MYMNDLSNNDSINSIFKTYTTDCSGYIIYPSIYKQRYDDISSENKNYYILETGVFIPGPHNNNSASG